jgi:hypothetical protein
MQRSSSITDLWQALLSVLGSKLCARNTASVNFVKSVAAAVGALVLWLGLVVELALHSAVSFSDMTRTRYLHGGASAGTNLVSLIFPMDTIIKAVTLSVYVNSAGGGDAWYVWVTDNQVVPGVNDVELQGVIANLFGIVMGTTPGFNGAESISITGISYKISRNGLLCLHTRAAAGQVVANAIVHTG